MSYNPDPTETVQEIISRGKLFKLGHIHKKRKDSLEGTLWEEKSARIKGCEIKKCGINLCEFVWIKFALINSGQTRKKLAIRTNKFRTT